MLTVEIRSCTQTHALEPWVKGLGRWCISLAPIVQSLRFRTTLQIEPRAHLLRMCTPFPILPTGSLNSLIHTPQLHREARAQLLQASSDFLCTLHGLAVHILNDLFRCTLVSEDVSVSSEEDVITLVVESDDLSALDLWAWREERFEQMGCHDT
jgi:hypothetical protein